MPEHTTIHVRFIDATTGKPIGEANLSVDELPQSFESATTQKLGDKTYEIVSTHPTTAREFRKSGTLRIEMREVKVTLMDPREILYTMPTISEEFAPMQEGSTKVGRQMLEVHEDDWRQVEFVALTLQNAIETDLRAIERIYTQHRTGPGFNALHLRKEVPRPLEGTWLTLADLRASLGETVKWWEGLSFRGVSGVVAEGFAVKLPSGVALYGTQKEGRINVLGLHRQETGAALEGDSRLLAALATKHQLCIVDWCQVRQLPSSAQRFQDWLSGRK